MKKICCLVPLLFVASSIGCAVAATYSGQAVQESGQASGKGSASAAHAMVASGQVTSAASAVPLSVGGAVLGSVGAASSGAARDSMNAATAPIGTPLEITNESVTVMPPNEALKIKADKKQGM